MKPEQATGGRTTPGPSLVARLTAELRRIIERGDYKPGDRLPSEAEITRQFGVSRTVVREAVAALRADGLVQPRQGSGVYVVEREDPAPFAIAPLTASRLGPMMELLELRTAVEVEAAGLAALRRSPAQEERIVQCLQRVIAAGGTPASSAADLELHLAIADATNNPRFGEFLRMLGQSAIPRQSLGADAALEVPADYVASINAEHNDLVEAILEGDEEAARTVMRRHLKGSLQRYRALMRQAGDR